MFERVILQNPIGADRYMRYRFGDYMKMPSKDKIIQDQHALKWDLEKDYSEYVNSEKDFSDERILV